MTRKTALLAAPLLALILLAALLVLPTMAQEGERAPDAPVDALQVTQVYTSSPGLAIPDSNCPNYVTDTINVPASMIVADVNVGLNISHTYRGDLDIYLRAPGGTLVELLTDVGGSADHLDVMLDEDSLNDPDFIDHDPAPPYYDYTWNPEGNLDDFNGLDAQGDWTIEICDDAGGDIGTLNFWSLWLREPYPTYDWPYNYKQAPYKVEEGQAFDYVLIITNTGLATGSATYVDDPLPIYGVSLNGVASWTPVGAGVVLTTFDNTGVSWLGVIPAGQGIIITIPVTVTAGAEDAIINTATIADPQLTAEVELTAYTRIYPTDTIFYYEDFNADDGGLVGDNEWEWGIPTGVSPEPHSWSRLWATDLDDNYDDDTISVLTAVIDLSGVPPTYTAELQWWEWLSTENCCDEAFVKLSSDSVPTPTLIYGQESGGLTPDQRTHEEIWWEFLHDVTPYVGEMITLTFTLQPDGSINDQGWYIDDLAVHMRPATPEFAGSYKTAEWYKLNPGDLLTYTVYITNSGGLASTDGHMYDALPAGLQVADASLVGAGSLASGADWVEWSTSPADPMEAGEDAIVTIVVTTPLDAACGAAFTNTTLITDSEAEVDVPVASSPVSLYPVIHYAENLEADDGGFVAETNLPAEPGWEWGAPAYAGGPAYAHSGANVWGTNLTGEYADGLAITLTSQLIDLSGADPVYPIYMQWWYWLRTMPSDWSRVYVSSTTSGGWVEVWSNWQGDYDWTEEIVDLTAYRGDMLQVRFEFASSSMGGTDAGWYIDDLAIHQGCDLLAPDFTSSWKDGPSKVRIGEAYIYTVYANNIGWVDANTAAITDTLPAGTEYAGGAWVVPPGGVIGDSGDQVWWNGVITSGGAVAFYIPVTITAECGAVFTNTALIDDSLLEDPVTVYAPFATAYENLYYAWDFEADDGGFIGEGDWEWGVPAYDEGPDGAHSGFNVWGTNLTGDYSPDASDYLTRSVDLTGVITENKILWLQWWDWLHLASMDHVHVEINGEEVWEEWGGTTGSHEYWVEQKVDVSAYAGQVVTLAFRFESNASTEYAGWYVDDVALHLDCEVPPPVLSLDKSGPAWVEAGEQMVYIIDVANDGYADALGVVLTDTLDPSTTYAGGASANYGNLDDSQGAAGVIAWSGDISGTGASGIPLQITIPVTANVDHCGETVTNSVSVEHDSLPAPLEAQAATQLVGGIVLLEDFEDTTFPPTGWAQAVITHTGDSPTWTQVMSTLHPAGYAPHNGDYMARFNSYEAGPNSSTRLYYAAGVDLAGATEPELAFWMFHDGEFIFHDDRVQVEVSTDGGITFTNVGDAIWRSDPNVTGWLNHVVDLAAFAGQSDIVVSLKGISDHGNDVYVDDVVVYKGCSACDLVEGADFDYSPAAPEVNETITFTGTVTAGDEPIVYSWDFGDEGTAMGVNVTHAYASVGEYTVWMTATNCGGVGSSVISHTLIVTEVVCDLVEGADFDYSPAAPEVNETITFTGTVTAGDEPIVYSWDFGDEGTATGANVTHAYASVGEYTVWMTATNCGGVGSSVISHTLTVTEVTCIPVTGVDLSLLTSGTIYTDTLVEFEADIAPDNATKPYSYTIDYGDSTPAVSGSSSADPLAFDHTYTDVGTYTVEIEVSNCGMTTPVVDTVQVVVSEYGVCVKVATVDLSLLTSGDIYTDTLVEFEADIAPNNATLPYSYTIDYGDGTLLVSGSSSADPLAFDHTYTDVGTYMVEFGVWNCGMAVPTITDTVEVVVISAVEVYTTYLPIVIKNN